MSLDLSKLKEGLKVDPDVTKEVTNTTWDYIASFIVDLRNEYDYEILDRSYITVRGTMDSECYFSECLHNAELTSFLNTEFTGKLNIDMEPGVYRLVYGVNAKGDSYWTDCGMEYDAWEEYELLNSYKYTEKEEQYTKPFEEEMIQLETSNESN